MASTTKTKDLVPTEHFDFGLSSDIPIAGPRRNIAKEVRGGGDILDVDKTIDAFEEARGFGRKKKRVSAEDYSIHNIVLDPEKELDGKMLNELLNDPKYMITYYKDNWTPQGTYRVFVIYGKKKEDEPQST